MSSPGPESFSESSPKREQGGTQNETGAVTVADSENEKPTDRNRPTLALKMLNLCRELTLMVFIAFTYAALTNERPPKVTKSPAAYPFFPPGSPITDWYKGQITRAIESARSADIAFVMFYAPWDAKSQAARKELELTAKYLANEIAFAAVNCWQPGSECKRQYIKVYKWPVLIAYPTHGRGVQYNGPLEAAHMVKFLEHVCRPVVRVEGVEELMGKYDIVILGTMNVLPGSYEYAVFYSTALRFLERDPFREAVFAVVSQHSRLAPSIELYNWNGTIKYDDEWNTETLSTWIVKNSYQITGWATPSGMKSLNLAGFLQPGPTLVLFTPRNPLLHETDYYNMLKEMAYEYYDCANETHIAARRRLVTEGRLKNREELRKIRRHCRSREVATNTWTNTSIERVCDDALDLNRASLDRACRDLLLAQNYATPIFERRSSVGGANVTGLACASNSSLKFVAIDSLRYYHFAERLGVDLTASFDKSGVAIVNEKMETHHVMTTTVTTTVSSSALRSFVYNFTQKTLSRSLRSKLHVKTKHNHFYPHLNCSKSSQFCVLELTASDFLSTVLQRNKVVVVFYYTKQCSFCNGIGYIFLTTAKMLSRLDDIIFARIDGELNLLPWEYTMESFPSILFFPKEEKSESRSFPKNIPITVPNLLSFILANLKPVLKLKTMWTICSQAKFQPRCMGALRMETLGIIGKTLREWRSSSRKNSVLYKLQMLRHLHLLFAHFPDETVKITTYFHKLRD